MDKLKFLATDNAVQQVYSSIAGVMIPVGSPSGTSKAPSLQLVSYSTTQTSITVTINVGSAADLTYIGYELWDPEGSDSQDPEPTAYGDLTVQKGTQTFTIDNLELGSGPYNLYISASNENGDTVYPNESEGASPLVIELQPYTNWASADEILEGNKAISDGVSVVGTIPARTDASITTSGMTVSIPNGYYPNSMTVTPTAPTETTTITENGTYTPSDDKVGFSEVTVAVPNGTETTTITENGTYTPSDDKVGFSEVTVNVTPTKTNTAVLQYNPNGFYVEGDDMLYCWKNTVVIEDVSDEVFDSSLYDITMPNNLVYFNFIDGESDEPMLYMNSSAVVVNGKLIITGFSSEDTTAWCQSYSASGNNIVNITIYPVDSEVRGDINLYIPWTIDSSFGTPVCE